MIPILEFFLAMFMIYVSLFVLGQSTWGAERTLLSVGASLLALIMIFDSLATYWTGSRKDVEGESPRERRRR